MTDNPYHEIPYECKWCGLFGHALGFKECTIDWLEQLHSLLTCNRCADKLTTKRLLLDALRHTVYVLETGSILTKTGHRQITTDERINLERDKAIQQRKLREVIGELNTLRKKPHESRTPADTEVLPPVPCGVEHEGGEEQSAPESLQGPL